MAEEPVFSLMITKRGGRIHTWKRRRMTITRTSITYHIDEKNHKSIPMTEVQTVVPFDACSTRWPSDKGADSACFGIVTEQRTYFMYADKVAEALVLQCIILMMILERACAAKTPVSEAVALRFNQIVAKPSATATPAWYQQMNDTLAHVVVSTFSGLAAAIAEADTMTGSVFDNVVGVLNALLPTPSGSAPEPPRPFVSDTTNPASAASDEQQEPGVEVKAEVIPEQEAEAETEVQSETATEQVAQVTDTDVVAIETVPVDGAEASEGQQTQTAGVSEDSQVPEVSAEASAQEAVIEVAGAMEASDISLKSVAGDPEADEPAQVDGASSADGLVPMALGHGRTPAEGESVRLEKDDQGLFVYKPGMHTIPETPEECASRIEEVWSTVQEQVAATPQAQPVVEDSRFKREVRVFVSSTFADMFSEREVLIRQVFPRIKALCQQKGLSLFVCDLRWGVPKESTSETVFKTCLGEIDNCVTKNTNPFFINLLGHRYGWVPVCQELTENITVPYQWVNGASITHMEILHGAFRNKNPNAAFFIRDGEFMDHLPEHMRPKFEDEGLYAQESLKRLKTELRERFDEGRVVDYKPSFDKMDTSTGVEKALLKDLDGLGEAVFAFLQSAINAQYPEDPSHKDPTMDEVKYMYETKSLALIPDVPEVERIVEYCQLETPEPTPPLVLEGRRGEGKRSVLTLAGDALQRMGIKVAFLFEEFLTGDTKDLEQWLQLQLDADEKFKTIDQMFDYYNSKECSVAILYYTIDFSWTHEYVLPYFSWKGIRVIAVNPTEAFMHSGGLYGFNSLLLSKFTHEEQKEHWFRVGGCVSRDLAAHVIVTQLAKHNKKLDDEQLTLVLDNLGAQSMIWLIMVCEELRTYGVFETVTQRIQALPPSCDDLATQVVKRLLEEDNNGLIRRALLMLCCATDPLYSDHLRIMVGPACDVDDAHGDEAEAKAETGKRALLPLGMMPWLVIKDKISSLADSDRFGNITLRGSMACTIVHAILDLPEIPDAKQLKELEELHPIRCDLFDVLQVEATSWNHSQEAARQSLILGDVRRMAIAAELPRVTAFPSLVQQLFQHLRCRTKMANLSGHLPKNDKMCMSCSMKIRDGSAYKHRCGICGCRLMNPLAVQMGKPAVESAVQKKLYRCRQHNDMLAFHANAVMQKCFYCNFTLSTMHTCDVMLCNLCSREPFRCGANLGKY
eukprot:m.5625 g.5625  ORF g.5625 m.5625 type:complete len:1195 (+) comp5076_c0_seq1:208-3792(+)